MGSSQAFACWKWGNFLATCGDQQKPSLLLNMDETSVRLCPRVRKGWVVVSEDEDLQQLRKRAPGPSLQEKRSALSLVCFLAASSEFQHLLPQIFLSNEHVLTKTETAALNEATQENTFFLRRKSAWVNHTVLVQIVRLLVACLGGVIDSHRVILSMDTYKAHLHLDVVRECARLGIFLYFVPACMTKWLQPLDVLVFKKYKEWIATEAERRRALAPTGKLSKIDIFTVCADGVPAVVEGEPWGRAFDLAGVVGQAGTSAGFLERLGCHGPVSVAASLPSATDLMAVYPRRSRIPVDDLFALVRRMAAPPQPVLVLPKRARLTVKTTPPPPLPPPAMQ